MLTNCYACQADISQNAQTCPQCGQQYPSRQAAKNAMVTGAIAVMVVVGLVWALWPVFSGLFEAYQYLDS